MTESDQNGKLSAPAVACLVLGLMGLFTSLIFLGGILAVVGLILGIVSLRRQRNGIAAWGVALCIVSICISGGLAVFVAWAFRQMEPSDTSSPRSSPDWQSPATHSNAVTLCDTEATRCERIESFCLDADGRILVADSAGRRVRVVSPDDTLHADWPLPLRPQAIAAHNDGAVAVAGHGAVALLTKDGVVVKHAELDDLQYVSDIEFSSSAVLVCARTSSRFTIYRLDDDLQTATVLVKGLRGCCRQLDFATTDTHIYVAANCSAAIEVYDLEGRKVRAIVETGEMDEDIFVGCCEPKNVWVASDGSVYATESHRRVCFRFSNDGKLLDRVGVLEGDGSCVRLTVAVTEDASRVYLLDTSDNTIKYLKRNKPGA